MKTYKLLDDDELLKAFQDLGEDKAFEEIYERYWFKLYSWAYKQCQSEAFAEDLVQAVFENVWRNRQSKAIKNIGPYLAVSLRHSLFNAHKRLRLVMEKDPMAKWSAHVYSPENEINGRELLLALEKSLQQLPSKTQEIFRLSRYEEKPVAEIAEEMNLTKKAVEYHITKALKFLKLRLGEYFSILF